MSDKAKVALVNMPFSHSKYPSIQLGTLSALLKSKGIPVAVGGSNPAAEGGGAG